MTLVEFLNARLAEREAKALAATSGEWAALNGGVVATDHEDNDGYTEWPVSSTQSSRDRANRVHIAEHSPASVLREVGAQRRIITNEQDRVLEEGPLPERMRDGIETDVMALLALPYGDHPDYQEAWRV